MTGSGHGSCESSDPGQCRLPRSNVVLQHHVSGDNPVRDRDLKDRLVDVIDTAIGITQADFGDIRLLDAVTGHLTIVAQKGFPDWWLDYWQSASQGQGASGTALELGSRVIVEDVELSLIFAGTSDLQIQRRAQVRAVQSTPIINRSGERLGIFSTYFRQPHSPEDRELRLLDQIARQAADTIERDLLDQKLIESEERYRNLFTYSPDAIFISQNDLVIMANAACNRLFRATTDDQLIGCSIYDLFHSKYHPAIRRRMQKLSTSGGAVLPIKKEIVRLDGKRIEVEVSTISVHVNGSSAVLRILCDITDRKLLEQQILNVSTAEQERLGQELHDGIGQQLTAMNLMAGHLARKLKRQNLLSEADAVGELGHYLQQALGEVRALARGLSPIKIGPLGLPSALSRLIEDVRAVSDVRCELVLSGENDYLPEPAATHLYRIAQEALNNALKHAQADKIRVELNNHDHAVTLSVHDNGIGIGREQTDRPGIGLQTMHTRCGIIGGELTVSAHESGGTLVECTCPLTELN